MSSPPRRPTCEPAAIALIDSVVRLLPGIMGAEETLAEESFEAGLLEYPHYTRPADWCGRPVPDVLMSGHHEKIRAWRKLQAEETTKSRRPDLWAVYQQKAPKVGAASYLSGLLIGTEIAAAPRVLGVPEGARVCVLGAPNLRRRYVRALSHRGIAAWEEDGAAAVLAGFAALVALGALNDA